MWISGYPVSHVLMIPNGVLEPLSAIFWEVWQWGDTWDTRSKDTVLN
jgi:hypothetical protein